MPDSGTSAGWKAVIGGQELGAWGSVPRINLTNRDILDNLLVPLLEIFRDTKALVQEETGQFEPINLTLRVFEYRNGIDPNPFQDSN